MVSTSSFARSRRSRAGLPLRLTGIQLGLAALAAFPAWRFGGATGLQSLLWGAGLSWVAVIASYAGLSLAFRNVKPFAVLIVIGGFLVRLVILFGLLTWVAKTMRVNLSQIVLWLVGFYMVLVVAEAYILAQGEKRRPEA